jgi:hypothetical protein
MHLDCFAGDAQRMAAGKSNAGQRLQALLLREAQLAPAGQMFRSPQA